jgi:hypothetical protein
MTQNTLIVDYDCSNFFVSHEPDELNLQGLQAWVDQYADTQVSHLFLNPNAQRTDYDSNVWESMWRQDDPQRLSRASDGARKWANHLRLLYERGLDPYAVWIDRCHQKGISPWLSMRMNEVHDTDNPDSPLLSTFWRKHPEYRRVPGSPRGYEDQQLDFAHEPVRRYALALLDEFMHRYDADGVSLDWMRFPYNFRPGHEQAGRLILNEFMTTVRTMARKRSQDRGRELKIAARVPADPQLARGFGLDGIEWVRRGLVDILIVTPFWGSANFDLPMELWREMLGKDADRIKLVGGTEVLAAAWAFPHAKRSHCDIEALRGLAAGILHRGADQVYLFNFYDRLHCFYTDEEYGRMLREVGDLQTVLDKPRRHIVTYIDALPPGVPCGYLLPHQLTYPNPAQFRIYTGPKPAGGRVTLRVGLEGDNDDLAHATLAARCNCEPCAALPDITSTLPPHTNRYLEYDIPLRVMQEGYNLAELFTKKEASARIVWVELRIDPTYEVAK